MTMKITAEYGTWKSPVTADMVAAGTIGFGTPIVMDGKDVYWVETRPSDGGRSVLVHWKVDEGTVDVTCAPFDVRTRVHEYGGGAFLVDRDTVYFMNNADQRIYRREPGGTPYAITPEGARRYADGVADVSRDRIIYICEDHTDNEHEPVNRIVAVECRGKQEIQTLVEGNDFYAAPRVSPDGTCLTWLTWNHPDMPWDATELWLAGLGDNGELKEPILVAGGIGESVSQPKYSPDGVLYFISDRTGWWNLYRWNGDNVEPVVPMKAEFGGPDWVFGRSNYGFCDTERIICSYTVQGTSHLAFIDVKTGEIEEVDVPYTTIAAVTAASGKAVFIGASAEKPAAVLMFDSATGRCDELRSSSANRPDCGYLAFPEAIEYPTGGGMTAHAFFYAPVNKDYEVPAGERPPLIVISHGGPTGATSTAYNPTIQYWTSRGFAVADVNYSGSTGYGRAYRERLNGNWGIVDVDDCIDAAVYLVQQGAVDAQRLVVRGGSAGGYTTLAALAFRDTFKAGACYYGVSDLEALAKDTHKFESRYLDRLIGPYPERRDIYRERSPLYHVDGLSCPVIFFQGSEDRVVPPNQTEMMAAALRKKHIPVEYILFEGEQHGFRRAENIVKALDAELHFYVRVFGFTLPNA